MLLLPLIHFIVSLQADYPRDVLHTFITSAWMRIRWSAVVEKKGGKLPNSIKKERCCYDVRELSSEVPLF